MKNLLLAAALIAMGPLQVLAAGAPQAAAPQVKLEENALTYLLQVNAAIERFKNRPEGELEDAEARRIVEENAAVFPLLERAAALPLRFADEGPGINSDKSRAESGARHGADLLALRGRVQNAAGDFAEASRSGLLCIALGLKLQEDGGLISAFSGYMAETTGWDAMETLALKWDAATLKSVARALGEIEKKRPEFVVVLASENESWTQFLRADFQRNALKVNGYDKATQDRLLAAWREVSEQEATPFLLGFPLTRDMDFKIGANEPMPEGKLPVVDDNFDTHAWAESWQRIERSSKHTALFLSARAQTRSALLQTALAARAYRLEHGAFPKSLQVLVPDYLPAVPTDPFGINEPLQFKSGADGLSIYSVGPDGVDDGGQPVQRQDDQGQSVRSRKIRQEDIGDMTTLPELLKP